MGQCELVVPVYPIENSLKWGPEPHITFELDCGRLDNVPIGLDAYFKEMFALGKIIKHTNQNCNIPVRQGFPNITFLSMAGIHETLHFKCTC